MLKDFLREAIGNIVGKQSEEIADLLYRKKPINEFLIAKKLDITINQTRNILYRISEQGLVSSIRKKDKKKGWYTYFWRLEALKCLEFLKKILIRRIEQINNQIRTRETKRFYVCERCNIELNEENALLYDFTCRECGDIFVLKDNTKLLKEFKRNRDKIGEQLNLVEEEIKKEEAKEEKSKRTRLKKEPKKAKQKKKAGKKPAKKKAKKKTAKKKIPKRVITKKGRKEKTKGLKSKAKSKKKARQKKKIVKRNKGQKRNLRNKARAKKGSKKLKGPGKK